jgi:tetratricopeptide (TPR) repeat protein
VGREALLDRLIARLTSGDASVSTGGTGGAGKTTLAVKLAHDPRILAHFTEGVLWAALGKDPTIEAILADWAGALGLDVSGMAEPADRAKAIKNAIGARRVLLIIDDVWDESASSVLRCGGPNCAHLLTTRDDGIARAFAGPAATEKVPELEPDPAFELLQRLAPEICASDPEAARALADAVGGLPLAIELLGGYLGDPEHSGLTALRTEALREMSEPARRLKLARERLGGRPGERPTLEQTIALSLDDLPEEVVQAFYCLGAFAPKPDTFAVAAAEAVANASVFSVLLKRNMIESPDGEHLSIHPVIAEYACGRMPTDIVTKHRRAYMALLYNVRKDWRTVELAYGQVRHAWINCDDISDKVDLVYLAGSYQRRRGLWDEQINWGQEALLLALKGHLMPDVAALSNGLGLTYQHRGQWQKALECYERAMQIQEGAGNEAALATSLHNIGGIYDSLGHRQKALQYYQRALSLREALEAPAEVAVTLNNIGDMYESWGDRQVAIEYFERSLKLLEEADDLQKLAITLGNIGGLWNGLGQHEKALTYYERALPICEAEGDRQTIAITLGGMGLVYHSLKQLQKALEYYQSALLIHDELGSRDRIAQTLGNIGSVFNLRGEHGRALEYHERALALLEEIGDRPGIGSMLGNIGFTYNALGHPQEAVEHYTRALSINQEVGNKPSEAVTRFNLGHTYWAQGKLPEALEHLRRCVELDEIVQHPDLEKDRVVLRQIEAAIAAQSSMAGRARTILVQWLKRALNLG